LFVSQFNKYKAPKTASEDSISLPNNSVSSPPPQDSTSDANHVENIISPPGSLVDGPHKENGKESDRLELSELRKETQKIQTKIKILEQTNKILLEEKENLEARIRTYQKNIQDYLQQIAEKEKKTTELQNLVTQLKSQMNEIEQRYNAVRQERDTLQSDILQSKEVITQMQKTIDKLRHDQQILEKQTTRQEELNLELKSKEEHVKKIETELQLKGDDLKRKENALREREIAVQKMEESLKEKEMLLKKKEETITKYEAANKDIKNSEAMLFKEKEERLQKREHFLNEREESLKQKEEILKKFEQQIKLEEEKISSLQSQIQQREQAFEKYKLSQTQLQHIQLQPTLTYQNSRPQSPQLSAQTGANQLQNSSTQRSLSTLSFPSPLPASSPPTPATTPEKDDLIVRLQKQNQYITFLEAQLETQKKRLEQLIHSTEKVVSQKNLLLEQLASEMKRNAQLVKRNSELLASLEVQKQIVCGMAAKSSDMFNDASTFEKKSLDGTASLFATPSVTPITVPTKRMLLNLPSPSLEDSTPLKNALDISRQNSVASKTEHPRQLSPNQNESWLSSVPLLGRMLGSGKKPVKKSLQIVI
jgi:chromosome segregation ATPase